MHEVITNNLDLWTSALLNKSSAGRGSNGKKEAYGIKKLRELILELAVRGKLVPHDPNDEPANVLLDQIAKEKIRLIEAGVIRNEMPLPEVSEEEIPHKIPSSWKWLRITELYYSISPSGKKLKTSQIVSEGQYPVVDQGQSYIAGYTNDPDLLIEIPGPVVIFGDHTTEIKYVDFNFVAGADGTKILRPYLMDEKFFYTCLKSYKLENRGYARHFKVLNANLMALPPLAEQHRIVAKVDELMALCDQLEQQQTHSIEAHQTLVETLLGALTSVASPQEFTETWTRIADHFDTLFTTEHSIDQLKQTILQLAVMGKLVPQDPNDEPANVLLEIISKEKEMLVREGSIRKEKLLSDMPVDQFPFDLPNGWAWTRLGEIVFIKGGKRVTNGYQLLTNPTPYIYIRVSDMKDGSIDDSDLKYIDEDMYSKISQYIITKHDVYMTIVGATIGKCGLVPDKFDGMNLTENAARLIPVIVSKYYLYKILSTAFCQDQFIDKTKQVGVQKMALNRLASTSIPLPPLAEQHRIVAKVDELMALCDVLKARIKDAQTTQIHLADAIVEQAVA